MTNRHQPRRSRQNQLVFRLSPELNAVHAVARIRLLIGSRALVLHDVESDARTLVVETANDPRTVQVIRQIIADTDVDASLLEHDEPSPLIPA